jgi:hypothetical protein
LDALTRRLDGSSRTTSATPDHQDIGCKCLINH